MFIIFYPHCLSTCSKTSLDHKTKQSGSSSSVGGSEKTALADQRVHQKRRLNLLTSKQKSCNDLLNESKESDQVG